MSGLGSTSGVRRAVACGAALVAALVAGPVVAGIGAAGAATSTWNVSTVGGPVGGDAVVIAVVDTGVDADHPAFGDRVLPQIDVVDGDGDGDGNGHGTHVAGTAAGGAIDCGSGATAIGVAPQAQILPVRVLDDEGRGTVEGVAAGIRAAADRGAEVINLSLGPEIALGDVTGPSSALEKAIDEAWSKGSIPVLAAGNRSLLGGVFGSGYGDVRAVVVTATTADDRKAAYATSIGSADWGMAAPGGAGGPQPTVETDVLSAWKDDQCALLSGTSMAAPHVSGALAVLRSRGLGARQAVDRVLSTARRVGSESTYGAGLLDLTAAMDGISTSGSTDGPSTTAASTSSTAPVEETDPTTAADRDAAPTPTSAAPGGAASSSTSTDTTAAPNRRDATTSTTSTTSTPDEVAADLRIEPEEDERGVMPLALIAGGTVAGMWLFLGRAALRRRG